MADTTITGLPNASALSGAERVPMDQSGTTVDAAASAIAALATKATVGLSNCDNTSDLNKPVSTATQTALDAKATAGAIGSSGLTMTAGVLGQTGAGAPLVLSLGSGLSIVGGALTVAAGGSGTVTSVGLSVPTGLAITGSPVTTSGTLALAYATGYSLPTTASQAQWATAYSERNQWDGGSTGLVAATGRTSLELGSLATQSGTFSGTSSGTNTGDNAVNSLYSGLVSNASHTGDATGSTVLTLATVNANVGSFGSATVAPIFTVNAKGLVTAASTATITPAIGSITGLGTGIATALAINTGATGAPVLFGGALGTPSSATLTNATGLPLNTGVTGTLPVANGGTGTATPGLVQGSNVTITGAWPNQTINATGTGGSLTVQDEGSTLSAAVTSINFTGAGVTATGTSSVTVNIPAGTGGNVSNSGTPTSGQAAEWASATTVQGVAVTGTGSYVKATSPTLVTPILGTPTSGTLTNCTGLPAAGVSGLAAVATSGAYGDLSGRPTLGTAAPLDVAATGDASSTQVVKGNDTRLSDSRTPTAHNQAWSTITSTPATLSGYGITDGFTEANVRATPLTGYTSGAGTITATDSVLTAIQKLNGNVASAGTVTGVTGTAPIASSGGAAPVISISAATTSVAGSMSSADKTKLDAITGTNTGDQTITLTGEVTGAGTGSFATTVANSAVIGKVLTGYTSGAGTVAATDSILQAIQKLNGNDAAFLTSSTAATTYQPLDADLTSIAALTTASAGRSLLTLDSVPSSPLVGTTDAQTLTGKTLGNLKETVYTITDGAAFDIDPANGPIQIITLGANRTPAATNFASGQSVKLKIDDGTAYAITWTTVGVVWISQTAGSSGIAPTLGTTGWTHIELWKEGSIVYGALIGYSAT